MTPLARTPWRIGALTLESRLVLAPMAGITDHHFRLMIRRLGGVGLVSMEFISADAVTRGIDKIVRKMRFSEEERPLAIQIYGSEPERMAECAAVVEALRPDLCDINMGCPANKILKGCAGASLLGDLPRAARIIAACRKRLSIPLTVKFRLGLGRGPAPLVYRELGSICEDNGVDAVTLHARTAAQLYTGAAEWEHLARLKEAVRIPVIGNGDVRDTESARRMLDETGVDAVMIGRAVMTDPWVFRRIDAGFAGRDLAGPTLDERLSIIRTHFSWIMRDEDGPAALHKLRTFLGRYTHGLPGGAAVRRQINQLTRPESFLDVLDGLSSSREVRA